MLTVNVVITVGDPDTNQTIIQVINAETIPVPNGDDAGAILLADQVIQRLIADVRERALEQAGEWASKLRNDRA